MNNCAHSGYFENRILLKLMLGVYVCVGGRAGVGSVGGGGGRGGGHILPHKLLSSR